MTTRLIRRHGWTVLCGAGLWCCAGPGLAQTNTPGPVTNAIVATKSPRALFGGRLVAQDPEKIVVALSDEARTIWRTNIDSLKLTTRLPVPAAPPPAKVETFVAKPGPLKVGATNPPVRELTLADLNTPAGQELVQTVLNEMIGARSKEATEIYLKTVQGLQSGQIDLRDVRNQAAGVLEELRKFEKELYQDPNSAEWLKYREVLRNFVERYDNGER
jgi:hypothetical protein